MLAYRDDPQVISYTDDVVSYQNPVFDHNKVYEVFNEVLSNPIYEQNMKKLQRIQQATGGRKLAVETIEKVHAVGLDHLID